MEYRYTKWFVGLLTILILASCKPKDNPTLTTSFQEGSAGSFCYGFIRNGALVLDCDGKIESSRDLHLEGFAISQDGDWLALKLSRVEAVDRNTETTISASQLINLNANVAKRIDTDDDLVASCGTLLASKARGDSESRLDLLKNAPFNRKPYSLFRCSEDASTVIGQVIENAVLGDGDWRLMTGYPPQKTILQAHGLTAVAAFDVSPSGEYFSYFDDTASSGRKVCVVRNGHEPECVPTRGTSPLYVSDTGQALFEAPTGEGCKFVDSWHFSPSPLEKSSDSCPAIFQWHAGLASPKMLQSLGRNPQWIPHPDKLKAAIAHLTKSNP